MPLFVVREHTGLATLTLYNAVFRTWSEQGVAYKVGPVEPYAQYPYSVDVSWEEPRRPRQRQSRWCSKVIYCSDSEFLRIEVAGKVTYDSRMDVPCDMDHWRDIRARMAARRTQSDDPEVRRTAAASLPEVPDLPRGWRVAQHPTDAELSTWTRLRIMLHDSHPTRRHHPCRTPVPAP